MAKYRLGSTAVEAIRWDGDFDEVERFVGGDAEFRNGKLLVAAKHGPLWVNNGYWVVKSAQGNCIPLSDGIFRECYERV